MAKVLTARSVEAIKPDASRRLEIADAGLPGLYLVTQPSGAKSWAYRYRFGDKTRKLTLGAYPVLSLSDAREEGRKAAQLVGQGNDPSAAKAVARADAKEAAQTGRDKVSTLVEQYRKHHLSRLRTGDDAYGFIARSAVRAWGDRDIQTITRRDVVELLDAMVDAGSPIAANRTLAHLRAFFGWLKARDVIAGSPAEGVKPPVPERSRDRVLSDREIALFWRATEKLGEPFGPLYRLLLLTGARLREVAEMTDREIAGDLWTIPGVRAKNGEAHEVPLSAPASEALAGVHRIKGVAGYVFSTSGVAAVSGFAKAKARLDRVMAELAAEDAAKAGDEPLQVPPFVIHDLRRTAASGMARLGVAVHVVEKTLNHRGGTISGVAAIYNRFDYAAEKRAALEAWGRYVLALTSGKPAENVVRLEART